MLTRLVIVVALVTTTWFACSRARRADAPAPPTDPTRLSHVQHAQVPCVGCHRSEDRPGADDHRPCDDGACHRDDFLKPPGKLCEVCHTKVTTQPLSAPLKHYPLDDAWQALPSKFSHKRHLDAAKVESSVGFHVACSDCHTRGDERARPDHATCSRCHAAEAKLSGAPAMGDCAGCHQAGTRVRVRKRVIRGDLRFDHDRHKTERTGAVIRCETCHTQTAQAADYAGHAPPRVETCVGCHDDANRTPSELHMRACETCHSERTGTLTAIAPRSHLPATERPLDHTLAFRRDHAVVAENDAMRCAGCHTRMSGNPRQACDECHQTMQPADHRITWRELDHGAEAAADHTRCARCHVVEFCTACHAQRPRSHGLFGTFNTEHGRQARINVRACITCHGQSFCDSCHAQGAP
ncbi:MAG: cytochrome c3 family protein [Kofleriaceae bacterium]